MIRFTICIIIIALSILAIKQWKINKTEDTFKYEQFLGRVQIVGNEYKFLKTILEKWDSGTLDFEPEFSKNVYEDKLKDISFQLDELKTYGAKHGIYFDY